MKRKLSYWDNTPKKWRKIGDALLIASMSVASYAVENDIHWLAHAAFWGGIVAKFITNLFTEDRSDA